LVAVKLCNARLDEGLAVDGTLLSVSASELYARLGTASAPMLVDVRREDIFDAEDKLIIGAVHHAPGEFDRWWRELPFGRTVVVYCGHGGDVSQGVAKTLRAAGLKAAYLEGGISAWQEMKLSTRRKLRGRAADNRWVTREHPKIDRIACPWLISRFINPDAEFIYVPSDQVTAVANKTGGIPYDIKGAEFGHVGDRCSFDAIVRIFDIKDPALDRLATVVRGADTSRCDLAPECEGLYAISFGLSANFPDDHEMLRYGLVIYDALYTWCRKALGTAAGQPLGA
jgi:rhodanese-related sulfurtransferase